MTKTIHSLVVNDFPYKWSEILPDLLGQIYFNFNLGQALWVHNAHPYMRKVCNQYKYKSFSLLMPLSIILSNPYQQTMEAVLMLNPVISILYGLILRSTFQGGRGVALGQTGLNQCHHRRRLLSRIPVYCSYGAISSHLSCPSLSWRLTKDWNYGGISIQWTNITLGLGRRQRSGPIRSYHVFSQGMAFLAMLRVRWRNFPCTSLQIWRLSSYDRCAILST